MSGIDSIGIVYNPRTPDSALLVQQLVEKLGLSDSSWIVPTSGLEDQSPPSSTSLIITIGGDGTILRAASYINNLSIPIIGVNTGRLGFLAKIKVTKIDAAINAIINKKYEISERTLVAISSTTKNGKTKKLGYALNEISITRKNTTSLIVTVFCSI